MTSYASGFHAVREALAAGSGDVRTLYYQRGRRDARVQELIALAKDAGVRFEAVDRRWLDDRVGGSHQGVAALRRSLRPVSEGEFEASLDVAASPLLLVLDGVTDPRNLGACLRSATAAGVRWVLVPRRRSAPINDAALKAAAGAAERVAVVEVANLARRLEWLKAQGVWLIGADGDADMPWTAPDYTAATAVILGSEGSGLRRLTREACDYLVSIPMAGAVASLNVSVAAGILLFEAVRQRA